MNKKESKTILFDMTVLDIVSAYPETEAVFRSYDEHVGECICCQRLFETVLQIAKKYNLDLAELLENLNSAITD